MTGPMATATVVVSHGFEAAHRLPRAGGKCSNVHGHSWVVEWHVTGRIGRSGSVVDAETLHQRLSEWTDAALDHGCLLGVADPLLPALLEDGGKVHVFGDEHEPCSDLPWPTAENLAVLLHRVATDTIEHLGKAGPLHVSRVLVRQTAETTAIYP